MDWLLLGNGDTRGGGRDRTLPKRREALQLRRHSAFVRPVRGQETTQQHNQRRQRVTQMGPHRMRLESSTARQKHASDAVLLEGR